VDVEVELWQVVADAWDIELLVISGNEVQDPTASGTNPVLSLPVIPRGHHNNYQVILRREADGESLATDPDKPHLFNCPYTAHMVCDRLRPPVSKRRLAAYNIEVANKNMKRCPHMQTNNDGVLVLVGGAPAAIAGYVGPLESPRDLLMRIDGHYHHQEMQLMQ
jgi:hypothetical protein